MPDIPPSVLAAFLLATMLYAVGVDVVHGVEKAAKKTEHAAAWVVHHVVPRRHHQAEPPPADPDTN